MPAPRLEWGVAELALAGQTESGDQYLVQPFEGGILAAVVDGLGHGAPAAEAARKAVETLQSHSHEPLQTLVQRCHEALQQTRGVAMTLAAFQGPPGRLNWLGVGNVEAVLLRGPNAAGAAQDVVMMRGGVVGYQLPSLQVATLPVAPGDVLILATDGIRRGFAQNLNLGRAAQDLADHILVNYARKSDDALVLSIRYLG